MKLSMGDARYVKNETGAIILAVPAGEAADLIYTKVGSTPQIWGAYSPGSATGRIQVIRALRRPIDHGGVTLYFWDYSPKVAGPRAVADGYHNVDPFASFASAADDLWHNISYQAFLAACGKAMLKNRTAISYVAIANVRQAQSTSSSSDLMTSSSTTTVTSFVHPTWLFGTAIENGGPQAFQTAYLIPGCNTATDPRKCIVKGGS